MRYDIEIPNVTHIATCDNLKDVIKALEDSQCLKRTTVMEVLLIADSLIENGSYVGMMAEDHRHSFVVRQISDTLNI